MDSLLDDAPCGFLVFRDDGVITTTNRTLERYLGYASGELIGRKFESLMSIAGRIFCQTHFFPLLMLKGSADEIFLTLRSKESAPVPVLINAIRRMTDDTMGNHCVLTPVYQRKEYEAQLLQARQVAEEASMKNEALQRMSSELEQSKRDLDLRLTELSMLHEDLARFSKVISHDMQEPVRKIEMFSDVIVRELKDLSASNVHSAVERLAAAAAKLRRLITCLEEFVNVDTSVEPIDFCDLKAIVLAALTSAQAQVPNVTVNFHVGVLPSIHARASQLRLLFHHLLMNSMQFRGESEDGVQIRIAADIIQENAFHSTPGKYQYNDYLQIIFTDNGRGFSNEYADYVFGLFNKADAQGGGLGFGLALCRKIVRYHHGTIKAKSEPGKGVAITILLPVIPELDTEQPIQRAAEIGHAQKPVH